MNPHRLDYYYRVNHLPPFESVWQVFWVLIWAPLMGIFLAGMCNGWIVSGEKGLDTAPWDQRYLEMAARDLRRSYG